MNQLATKVSGTFNAVALQQSLGVRSAQNIAKDQLIELEGVNRNLGEMKEMMASFEFPEFE
jgi:hypothetical protein